MNLAQEVRIELPPMVWRYYNHSCRLITLKNGLHTLKVLPEKDPTGITHPAEGDLQKLSLEAKLHNLKETLKVKRILISMQHYLPTTITLKYLES